MLKFIKKFFAEEEPKPSIEIPRDKLLDWYDRHVYTEQLQNNFKNHSDHIKLIFQGMQENEISLF